MNTVEILTKARDLIAPEGAWAQDTYAKTADGWNVSWRDPKAVSWCAAGACYLASGGRVRAEAAITALETALPDADWIIPDYNDFGERTQQEIIDWFNAAIANEQAKS